MTTAEALEQVTDRGLFEVLATSVLRKSDPTYAGIVHVGVNAQGETIVSPIDGLRRVPESSPPHWIYVAHTTTERKRLKDKWLSDRADEKGDLVKAAEYARQQRMVDPSSRFTLVLCTNQRVDAALVVDVENEAQRKGLAVEFFEQQRLSNYLDTTADGQYIRRLHLNIDAERLSGELLRKLCEDSLSLYTQEMSLPTKQQCVSRIAEQSDVDTARSLRCGVLFVVGESGYGKSTWALSHARSHLEAGGYALWIPAFRVESGEPLAVLLTRHLRSLYPALSEDAGEVCLSLLSEDQDLLLVVDDVNRVGSSIRVVQKAVSWVRPERSGEADDKRSDVASSVRLVIPLWPVVWTGTDDSLRRATWTRTVHLGPYRDEEAIEAICRAGEISGKDIDREYARHVAQRLGRDPFLIGRFSELLASGADSDTVLSEEGDFLDRYIDEKAAALAVEDEEIIAEDVRTGLLSVARWMLDTRNLSPRWHELSDAFPGASAHGRTLRMLIKQASLCRLLHSVEGDIFQFRHDRIADRFLVAHLVALLESDDDKEVLTDPYFARLVGQAVASTRLADLALNWLREHAPLALAESLKHPSKRATEYTQAISDLILNWTHTCGATAIDSLVEAISRTLMETDQEQIREFHNLRQPNYFMWLAKLRNGCALSGARFLARHRHDLAAAYGDALRDRALFYAKRNHAEPLSSQLHALLSETDEDRSVRRGAVSLLGFLQLSGFDEDLEALCQRVSAEDDLLTELLWAAARCPLANAESALGVLFSRLDAMPIIEDPSQAGYPGERHGILEELGMAFRLGMQNAAIQFILDRAGSGGHTLQDAVLLLGRLDHPDVVEFLARRIADGWHFVPLGLVTGLGDNWLTLRRWSEESSRRLKRLWQDETQPDDLRRSTFALWVEARPPRLLSELRSISRGTPMYTKALWRRITLGDMTAVDELMKEMHEWYWWGTIAHHVWCEPLQRLANEEVGRLAAELPDGQFPESGEDPLYFMAEVLMKIPADCAKRLLAAHWERLQYSPGAIIAALYVASPDLLERVKATVERCPSHVNVFRHLSMRWGMRTRGRRPITPTQIEALRPYLDRIGSHDLGAIADTCCELGMAAWRREWIDPLLDPERRKRLFPTDEELHAELDEVLAEQKWFGRLYFWVEQFERRGDPQERMVRVLDSWLAADPTDKRLALVGFCLKRAGSRADLGLLEKCSVSGCVENIERLKEDTRFGVRLRTLE